MRRIAHVSVRGLFGHANHSIEFRLKEPTILVAPNGAGKTHLLRLTAAALSLDGKTLLDTVYDTFSIQFVDGNVLNAERSVGPNDHPHVKMWAVTSSGISAALDFGDEDLEMPDRLPPQIHQVGANRFVSERTGRTYTSAEMERRFKVKANTLVSKVDAFPEIALLCEPPRPIFIDTWRLDARADDTGMLGNWGRSSAQDGSTAASRIRAYVDNLREEIAEARRASIRVTQSADLSFAARALDAAGLTVNEASLHKRYDRTVERYEALTRNGLAVGEAPMPFPDSTSPTVRRILSVFLDDWDQRLKPLLPVNEKLQTLREILDSKLAPSGKQTAVSPQGGLEFYSPTKRRLLVSRLSSGEQHLVALFTLLLFAAKPGSLVLIDEPEISLHAAWKHAFLHDISRVAAINDLQIVLATHSAGIINGRWDLTEELELQRDFGDQSQLDELGEDEDELDV